MCTNGTLNIALMDIFLRKKAYFLIENYRKEKFHSSSNFDGLV